MEQGESHLEVHHLCQVHFQAEGGGARGVPTQRSTTYTRCTFRRKWSRGVPLRGPPPIPGALSGGSGARESTQEVHHLCRVQEVAGEQGESHSEVHHLCQVQEVAGEQGVPLRGPPPMPGARGGIRGPPPMPGARGRD